MITVETVKESSALGEAIHSWGCALSEVYFDPGWSIFREENISGFIGYKAKYGCAVVFGNPVCPLESRDRLVRAFDQFCEAKGWNVIYLVISEEFSKWPADLNYNILIHIGDELIFNPQTNPTLGSAAYRLRNKIHHAENIQLKAKEYTGHDSALEAKLNEVKAAWLAGRKGPQIYIDNLSFFDQREGRRWIYVEQNNKILSIAVLCKIESYHGWLLKTLMTIPKAPRGTSEFLMVSILDILREEGCSFLTYGIVPASKIGQITGLNKFSAGSIRLLFKCIKWLFKLENRSFFWQQFLPRAETCFVAFKNKSIGINEIRAIANALKIGFS